MPTLLRDDDSHTYTLDGVVIPSVTQILAPFKSFDGIPEAILNHKREVGTAVHYACELDVLGTLDEATVHEEVAGYLAGFRLWRAQGGFEIVETESYVHHPRLRYAGQLDLIGLRTAQRDRWLIDIKTAATHSDLWRLQTAGYLACRADAGALKRAVLQLMPTGKYRWHPYDRPEHAADAHAWVAAASLHHWMKANKP